MEKTVFAWCWAWNFDREEAWLNAQAEEGWALKHVGFCTYRFERTEPGAYKVRMELLDELAGSDKSQDYIGFVEGTGAQCVGRFLRWVYFRRLSELGAFDLFSDLDSRIRHLERLLWLLGIVGVIETVNGFNCLLQAGVHDSAAMGFIAAAALLLAGAIWCGFAKTMRKRKALRDERSLHE